MYTQTRALRVLATRLKLEFFCPIQTRLELDFFCPIQTRLGPNTTRTE